MHRVSHAKPGVDTTFIDINIFFLVIGYLFAAVPFDLAFNIEVSPPFGFKDMTETGKLEFTQNYT